MTSTTLTAHVFRDDIDSDSTLPWTALVVVTFSASTGSTSRTLSMYAHSHPEAMQAAYKALSDLDRELMDEVHASRSARRAAMDRHPAGKQRKEPEA